MNSAAPVSTPGVQLAGRRRGVSITATTWLPERDLPLEDWVCQGKQLAYIGKGVSWWIGDWLRYGNLRWGERYSKAARIIGYDAQTLMNMVYVASAYKPEDRRANLSWSHHAELAGLEPSERRQWMDVAEQQRMSVRCLREELRRERRRRDRVRTEPTVPAADSTHDIVPIRCPRCGFAIERSADGDDTHAQPVHGKLSLAAM